MTERPVPSPLPADPLDAPGFPVHDDATTPVAPTPVPRHAEHGTSDSGASDSGASAAADAGKQAAGEVAQTAADKAQDVAGAAKEQARNVLSEAQGQLQEQARAQHGNLVSNLRSLADELTSMADNADQSGVATHWVSEAGTRARTAADWIGDREPGQLVDEVRAFARRRPGTFILGALAAGVVAGRLTRGVVGVHQDDSPTDQSVGGTGTPAASDDQAFLAPPTTAVDPLPGGPAGYGS